MRGRQVTQQNVAEIDFVHLVIVTPQAESLTLKGLSDKATVIEPLDIALGIDGSNLKFSAGVFIPKASCGRSSLKLLSHFVVRRR